jgi:hypothetical protein
MSGLHKFEELTAHFTEEDWAAVAEMEAEIDATMPTDEPCAVVPMRMMRELEDAPLSEYAAEMQTDEAGVLAFEECDDAPVSQVAAYIKAMGGRMKVIAEFPDGDEVIIANFYRKRRWPIRSNDTLFGELHFDSDTATGPTTYRQIEWAAQTYRQREEGQQHAAAYRQVYTGEFRDALLNGTPEYAIERLLVFLNQINADLPAETLLPVLLASVPDAVAGLRHLVSATLYDVEGDGMSDWNSTLATRAADRLTADDGIDFALASQILSVVNPALFLTWDLATHNRFFLKNDPDDGFAAVRYSRFIWTMADAARAIREDALANHEIDDLAGHLSAMLGINPPYTLAKFIGEYNFLTITKGEIYPAFDQHQERHA